MSRGPPKDRRNTWVMKRVQFVSILVVLLTISSCFAQSKNGTTPSHPLHLFSSDNNPFSYPLRALPRAEGPSLPESNGTPENTTAPEPEAEVNGNVWPEPEPDWPRAYEQWKWAWELHVYTFATVFLGVACYSGWFIFYNLRVGLGGKYLNVTLNLMMFLLGVTRTFCLYVDPYLQGDAITTNEPMRFLWSLASPSLTSADSLLILTLIEISHISLVPPKMKNIKYILMVIAGHFSLVFITDLVVAEYAEAKAMLLFCQLLFVTWGTTLGVGYCVLAYRLDEKLFGHKEVRSKKEKIYIRLIYASGISNFCVAILFLYACFGVFGVYSDVEYVEAWPWWVMKTFMRLSEVVACVLVFTVSAQRNSIKSACDDVDHWVKDQVRRKTLHLTHKDIVLDVPLTDTGSDASLPGQLPPITKPGGDESGGAGKQETALDFFADLQRARTEAHNRARTDTI